MMEHCRHCGGSIDAQDRYCRRCGVDRAAETRRTNDRFLAQAHSTPASSGLAPIRPRPLGSRLLWFFGVNLAIVATLAAVVAPAAVLAPVWGSAAAFLALYLSKWLAKMAHDITIIDPSHFRSEQEAWLYRQVGELSRRAGLPVVPEVGIYASDDVNAFATGRSKQHSLVAFSSALLEEMDEQAVIGVAAHEIAHVANGDMVTMTMIQAVVNSIVLVITAPLSVIRILAFFSDDVDELTFWLISAAKVVITIAFVFLGSLVVKAFSRKREYWADYGAASLTNKATMIHALAALQQDATPVPKRQEGYAAFKIRSSSSWLDLFSTHPSLERRIERLRRL